MAHLVESMAYVGDTPWHGLGNRLSAHQPLQTWLVEAGMDWHIAQSDVLFNVAPDGLHIRPHYRCQVLYCLRYPGTTVGGVEPPAARRFSRMRCWASTRIWLKPEGLSWRRQEFEGWPQARPWRALVKSRQLRWGIK